MENIFKKVDPNYQTRMANVDNNLDYVEVIKNFNLLSFVQIAVLKDIIVSISLKNKKIA